MAVRACGLARSPLVSRARRLLAHASRSRAVVRLSSSSTSKTKAKMPLLHPQVARYANSAMHAGVGDSETCNSVQENELAGRHFARSSPRAQSRACGSSSNADGLGKHQGSGGGLYIFAIYTVIAFCPEGGQTVPNLYQPRPRPILPCPLRGAKWGGGYTAHIHF